MERDDIELIQRTLSGDETAFSDLVKKYQKSVHALAWRKIKDFHIAEEITQDTFLHVYEKLSTLREPARFAGWLYVIASRRCIAWQRKQKRVAQSMETVSDEILEKTAYANYVSEQREETAAEHRRQVVESLLEKLPESERTVMILHYLGEMSCERISKFLGVSVNTVKSRLSRARKRLRADDSLIHETLGGISLSPSLLENIMRNVATPKQTPSPLSKPVPWAALVSSAVLAILLIGVSNQYFTRFQRPYNLEAQSEPTIEIVDAPIILDIHSKPDLQNRVGNDMSPGKNSNESLQRGETPMKNNLAQDAMQLNLPKDAKTRFGKGKINEIQYSPDGKFLAVASGIGIWLYDVTSYQEASLLTGHASGVDSLAFSADGRTLASGSADTIILWDRSTGAQTRLTGHINWISSLAFSPDGKTVASDSRDGTIRLWNVSTGEMKYTLTKDSWRATRLLFMPNGQALVSVSWDNKISLWNSSTGKHKKTFALHPDCSVTGAAFSPDGKTAAIGSENGIIYLHDLDTGELGMELIGHEKHVDNLAFTPDGKGLATSSPIDETIRLWDVNTGEHRLTLTSLHIRYVRDLAFSPNGKTLASGSGDGTIRFWDAHTGTEKHTFTGHSESVMSVTFNWNGNIIASGSTDGIVRLWNADTGQHIKTLNGFNNDMVLSMLFSPDGKILTCGTDNGVYLWDVHIGEHKKMFYMNDPYSPVLRAFSPDGNTVASGVDDEKTISLWDVHIGERKKTLKGHTNHLSYLTFSPDGKTLASATYKGTIRLWDIDTGKNKVLRGHVDWVSSLAFSPDGKTLTSGSDDTTICFWDVDTGENMKILKSKRTNWMHSYALAFSPDGKTLASGDRNKVIYLWNAHTGEEKATLSGHTDIVRSIAFSPDGKTLVSGSLDGSVLLWEIDIEP